MQKYSPGLDSDYGSSGDIVDIAIMVKDEHGAFVLYSDIKAIADELDALKAELAKARKKIDETKNILAMGNTVRERSAWSILVAPIADGKGGTDERI
jgi:hypothetical protein